MTDTFPTRQYPYRREAASVAPAAAALATLAPDTLHRFIVGIDDAAGAGGPPIPQPLDEATLQTLNDPFARLLREHSPHPLTARTLVAALDALGMVRQSFVVGEGLQIPWTQESADLARQLRVAVSWKAGTDLAILLSTAPPFDDAQIFLQVIGWDAAARHFNYYERRMAVWSWAGNSRHALSKPTRGKGPFDSHVNGALVMKELKVPWLHWSSEAAFDLPGVAPSDPLQQEALFTGRSGAEGLERLVRSAVRRWTTARLDEVLAGNTVNEAPALLRHLVSASTVNLVCSAQESTLQPADGRLLLPVTPFLDTNLLVDVLNIPVSVDALSAPWEHYQRLVVDHGYELRDQNGRLAHQGDTHFAFPAFERSVEDLAVVAELVKRGVLSARLAACLAMVDFPNPVWSQRREALLRHVPPSAAGGPQTWDLSSQILDAISSAAAVPTSPEAEFLALWQTGPDWAEPFGQRLDDYLRALHVQMDSWDGFEAIGRLVESQRRRARKRPLLEFNLTLPHATKLDDANWRMTAHATIERY